ncbi:hypothetical protein Avbf_05548 [Armadillidium vulgare]|nr:hypothetical protein Avbf_05548 [Armadillidium vulgare]
MILQKSILAQKATEEAVASLRKKMRTTHDVEFNSPTKIHEPITVIKKYPVSSNPTKSSSESIVSFRERLIGCHLLHPFLQLQVILVYRYPYYVGFVIHMELEKEYQQRYSLFQFDFSLFI